MGRIFLGILISLSCASTFASDQVKPGDVAPEFSLTGADGRTYKMSEFKGKTVVLEWFNEECPYVHKFYDTQIMQNLQKDQVAKGVVWLTISSSAPGKEGFLDAQAAKKVHDDKKMMNTALLLDSQGVAAKLYGAKTTPHMFVIDRAGKIAYQGAMDDRPSAAKKSLDGASNYVATALQSMAKGKAVKVSSTAPYGCSVKY